MDMDMDKTEKFFFHSLSADDSVRQVGSSKEGLKPAEAKKRLEKFGSNQLPKPKRAGWLAILFKQLRSFLIVILIAAAGISYVLHDKTDAYIILAAVFLNVVVGFIQENKAEKSLEALREVISDDAKVLRSGQEMVIAVAEVVPGDVVLLDVGDKIPADSRLLEVSNLETNEAALTGESTEVTKQLNSVKETAGVGDRTNMIFTGTTVTQGSGKAVVVATGINTEIGRIAELLHKTKTEATPLQKKLDRFAKFIGIVVLIVSAVIMAIGLLQGMEFVEIFITSVAIAVAAIPEGLVVALTIILAIGMQRILKKNALVRNLQAAETLGSTSVICTDKTGTITEGKMEVVALVTPDYHFEQLYEVERHERKGLRELIFAINIGMLCNDAHIVADKSELKKNVVVGNFTEQALMRSGLSLGLNLENLKHDEPRIYTVPFDSSKKFMATLHKHPRKAHRIYMKGAPEKVIGMCTQIRTGSQKKKFTPSIKKKFEEQFLEFSKKGLRILALAYKDVPKSKIDIEDTDFEEMVFVGFVGIKDPLRPSIATTFALTERAGIKTVMITGDHKITAQTIAKELGLPAEDKNILTGDKLQLLTQEQLNEIVEDITVYARVSPEDKLNIIQAWKSKGKVVAMTGDGVNDSPALKAADIGIALGSGTDVAKEAADIVLLDDNYKTIVAAVEEGRGIFDNIKKVILYLVSDSFSEVLLIAVALMLGLPLPLTAAQILWINLVADGLPNVALTVDPREEKLMDESPRPLNEGILNSEMKLLIVVISAITGFGNIVLFWSYWKSTGDLELARSIVFATLAVDSLLYVFSVRTLRHSIFHKGFFANKWLLVAVGAAFMLQLSAFYFAPLQKLLKTVPLGLPEWGVIFGISGIVIALIELIKYIYIVRNRHEKKSMQTV